MSEPDDPFRGFRNLLIVALAIGLVTFTAIAVGVVLYVQDQDRRIDDILEVRTQGRRASCAMFQTFLDSLAAATGAEAAQVQPIADDLNRTGADIDCVIEVHVP